MPEEFIRWLNASYIEVLGALLGLAYIFLSVRQNILTWPVGLLTSALYVYVFYASKFYADMALQVYYVLVSIYGWYYWLKGNPAGQGKVAAVPVERTPLRYWVPILALSVALFLLIAFVLKDYTDSPIPVWDALTTALSIVATWMLARKYLENWLLWIFIDLLSAVLYGVKNLWPTVVLFIVYTIMAVQGYFSWKKDLIIRQAG